MSKAIEEQLHELNEKLDLIFFAQAEILVRMKQEPEESVHYPLYQKEALAVAVTLEQEAIKDARQAMLSQLAANVEPLKRATVRQLRKGGSGPTTLV